MTYPTAKIERSTAVTPRCHNKAMAAISAMNGNTVTATVTLLSSFNAFGPSGLTIGFADVGGCVCPVVCGGAAVVVGVMFSIPSQKYPTVTLS